jgi:hypothetical protein
MLQKLKNQAAKNVLNHYFVQCETGGFEPLLFVFWIWCAILLPQPVDRWEKETAAAQCVFSTLIWHNWVSLNWSRQFCYSYWVRHAKMAHSGKPTESNAIIFFLDIRSKCHLILRTQDAIYSWTPIRSVFIGVASMVVKVSVGSIELCFWSFTLSW